MPFESKYTEQRKSCRSQHMEMDHPRTVLNWLWLHRSILFMVGAFSMQRGCCCLKVITFDLDFIGVRSNLLNYLWGFACVSEKDETLTSTGILSSCKDLIKC